MRNCQKGWVLMDALIAMTILVVALTAFAVTFRQSTVTTFSNNNRTTAAYLAEQELSKLRQYDGTGKDRTSSVWTIAPSGPTDPTDPNSKVVYKVQTSVLDAADIPADLSDDIIPVKATVDWTEGSGEQTLQMVTYYYK